VRVLGLFLNTQRADSSHTKENTGTSRVTRAGFVSYRNRTDSTHDHDRPSTPRSVRSAFPATPSLCASLYASRAAVRLRQLCTSITPYRLPTAAAPDRSSTDGQSTISRPWLNVGVDCTAIVVFTDHQRVRFQLTVSSDTLSAQRGVSHLPRCNGRQRQDPSRSFSTPTAGTGPFQPLSTVVSADAQDFLHQKMKHFLTTFSSLRNSATPERHRIPTASMSPRLAARSYPRFGRCESLAKMRKPSYRSPDSDSTLRSRLEADIDRLRAVSQPRSELRGRLSTHVRSLTALVESSVSRNYGVPVDPPPSSLLSPRPDSETYLWATDNPTSK